MRVAFGWPKLYANEWVPSGTGGQQDGSRHPAGIILLHDMEEFCVVITQVAVHIWSAGPTRIRLASFVHNDDAVALEGHHIAACVVSSTRRIAVLTSKHTVHLFRVQHSNGPLTVPPVLAQSNPTLRAAEIILTQSITWPASHAAGNATALVADSDAVVVAFQDGSMTVHSWANHVKGQVNLLHTVDGPGSPCTQCPCIVQMAYAPGANALVLVMSDGSVALSLTAAGGLLAIGDFEITHWLCDSSTRAVCAALGVQAHVVAVGCLDGTTRLYSLSTGAATTTFELNLSDWGHAPDVTGGAVQLAWTPDSQALAVGYANQGFVVWSPSGCRLMSSFRQAGTVAADPSGHRTAYGHGGVSALAWTASGCRLLVAEWESPAEMREVQFVKPCRVCSHLQSAGAAFGGASFSRLEEVHVLHSDDRLLLVTEAVDFENDARHHRLLEEGDQGDSNDLCATHVLLPRSYLSTAWPVRHVSVSADGLDIAAAGTLGLALYSRRSTRWKLFGDVSQERSFSTRHLGWLQGTVVVASEGCDPLTTPATPTGAHQLALYPRRHLSDSTRLARRSLPQTPLAMDCQQSHILLAFSPFTILMLQVTLPSAHPGNPNKPATATLTAIRELALMPAARPFVALALVPSAPTTLAGPAPLHPRPSRHAPTSANMSTEDLTSSRRTSSRNLRNTPHAAGSDSALSEPAPWRSAAPVHCVILRWGGLLSLLDMDTGMDTHLLNGVESLWLSGCMLQDPTPSAPQRPIDSPGLSAQASGMSPRAYNQRSPSHMRSSHALHTALSRLAPADRPSGSLGDASGGESDTQPAIEMPWWIYGPSGVQLVFPSTLCKSATALSAAFSLRESQATAAAPHSGHIGGSAAAAPAPANVDAELEFDREVVPIGISLADAAIIGVTQRLVRGPGGGGGGGSAGGAKGAAGDHAYYLLPTPQSQPVLPCLLRRLIQRGDDAEALLLAQHHQSGPHFSRSLEWLLFTTLEHQFSISGSHKGRAMSRLPSKPLPVPSTVASAGAACAADSQQGAKAGQAGAEAGAEACAAAVSQPDSACRLRAQLSADESSEQWRHLMQSNSGGDTGPGGGKDVRPASDRQDGPTGVADSSSGRGRTFLTATANLLRGFPDFADVVVSVSRKTDAQMWPLLFSAVGPPSLLLQQLLSAGQVHSASCLLVVVDNVEGPVPALELALVLIQAALTAFLCDLTAELLRFVFPPPDVDADMDAETQDAMWDTGPSDQASRALTQLQLDGSDRAPGASTQQLLTVPDFDDWGQLTMTGRRTMPPVATASSPAHGASVGGASATPADAPAGPSTGPAVAQSHPAALSTEQQQQDGLLTSVQPAQSAGESAGAAKRAADERSPGTQQSDAQDAQGSDEGSRAQPPAPSPGFFSFLFGGGATATPAARSAPDDAATGASSDAAGNDDSKAADANALGPEAVDSGGSQPPAETDEAAKGSGDRQVQGGRSFSDPHRAPTVAEARRLIALHAWAWLSQGHLVPLADLMRALALVPCSLANIMQVYSSEGQVTVSGGTVLAAITMIREELPFHADSSLLSLGHDLLMLFLAVRAPAWRLAMALCLNQQTQLQHFRQRMPKQWQEVRAMVSATESLRDLWVAL